MYSFREFPQTMHYVDVADIIYYQQYLSTESDTDYTVEFMYLLLLGTIAFGLRAYLCKFARYKKEDPSLWLSFPCFDTQNEVKRFLNNLCTFCCEFS